MPATLSDEDKAFVRAILNSPADLTGWLAYADWLDERDDPRAEFIRLEVKRLDPNITQTDRFGVIGKLEDVRAGLDPDWVAVFDRPRIENCDELFAFKCPKKWENLKGTDNHFIRNCETCQKQVFYCLTIREAYDHARQGHCVAVTEAVPHAPAEIYEDPDEVQEVVTMGILMMPEPEPEPRRPWWKFW